MGASSDAAGSSPAGPRWHERLLDASSDLVTVHERDGAIRFASAAARRLLGLEPEDLVGGNPYRLVHPDDRDAVIEAMLLLRDQPHATHAFTMRARHARGGWLQLEAVARNRLGDPEVRGVIVSSRDVTARVQAEEALRASEARHRHLVESVPCGLTVVDQGDVVRFANPKATDMIGVTGDVVGACVTDLVHPDDHEALLTAVRAAAREGAVPDPVQCRVVRADGRPQTVRVSAVPYSYDDRPAALLMALDVTALREAQAMRAQAEVRLRTFLESSASGIVGLDRDARITFLNRAAAAALRLDAPAALGRFAHTLFHHTRADGRPYPPEECPCVLAARSGQPAQGTGETFWTSDGHPVPVDFQVTPLNGGGVGAVLTFQDVSERRHVEQQVNDHVALLNAVLEALSAQTAVVDRSGTIVEVNRAWSELSERNGGTPAATGVGVNVFEVCDRVQGAARAQAQAAADGLRAVLDGGQSAHSDDVTCPPEDGRPARYSSLQIVPLRRPEGGAVMSYDDITARKLFELQSAHRAMHDELTGLPNRALLLDRLEQALRERARSQLAVLFIDLDNFKLVNDGYGHQAGDEVLRELAQRLRTVVRPADTVARLAGDEFVILCERLPFVTEACQLAERIILSVSEPFVVDGARLSLGASIGIASGEDLQLGADDLLRAADGAMFEAKARGRNQYALYDDGIHQRSLARVEQALSLRQLVEDDLLTVHYQPVVDLRDGHVAGVEALLRWRGAGAPSAKLSVALAEETGLITEIGSRVLRQALRQAAGFRHPDGSVLSLSVNLAPQQLDPALIGIVVEAAAAAGYPLGELTLELTERTVMTDVASSINVLHDLRALGVQIAVDDFGVGYSSLAYLRDLPLDALKIDQAFIRSLTDDPRDERIISAIIQLGRALDLRVIAEGVESDEQRSRLLSLGCETGQGFLFGYPQPAEDIRQLTS